MHSFQVSDVKLVKDKSYVPINAEAVWGQKLKRKGYDRKTYRAWEEPTGATLLGCSPGVFLPQARPNPLIGAVGLAYNHHHPLSLSPAAIWLAISQGFSIWINENAEAVRKQFVSHEGKAKIEIRVPFEPDWNTVLGQFSEKIADHIGKKRDLFISDFSTTSLHERAASEVVLMYGMSKYFEYGMVTMCGFPRITLEGSVEDWERISDRVRMIGEMSAVAKDDHMKKWIDALLPTVDAFVASAKGNPDLDFWKAFYREDGGSGGPYVNGHVINFFPYLNYSSKLGKNEYLGGNRHGHGISPKNFDAGLSKVDVEWDRMGDLRKVEFHGGFVGVSMAEDSTLRPECGWGILDVTNFQPPGEK